MEEKLLQTKKPPQSLYQLSLCTFVNKLDNNVRSFGEIINLQYLPPAVLADIYLHMCDIDRLKNILCEELSDLQILSKLLRIGAARQKVFQCFSYLMSFRIKISLIVAEKCSAQTQLFIEQLNATPSYCKQCLELHAPASSLSISMQHSTSCPNRTNCLNKINDNMCIGSFLAETGALSESILVLAPILRQIDALEQDYTTLLIKIDCLQRLLHAQAGFYYFKDAARTLMMGEKIIEQIGIDNIPGNLLASWYDRVSVLYFSKSDYDQSYEWSIKALKILKHTTPAKITVDILRHASKSCVVKRQFKKANILIMQAVKIARKVFGKLHQKYSDVLLDYGFFLLNVDFIAYSVENYDRALYIRRKLFRGHNFHIAIALEDLAYALYVLEYSTGRFQCALDNVELAIDILRELVPSNHLMLASAKRVKALILEEIALDNYAYSLETHKCNNLLLESESLHQSALELSLEAFGEVNVQTAKHYGNLGRLYQSMHKFDEAESMHKRAIKIKRDLLGPYDYEVGLSIGHLASLYNYHMSKHREAEKLYLESISISLRLFGQCYSGLEYDYRGLCHVYEKLNLPVEYTRFEQALETWRILRSEGVDRNSHLFSTNYTLEEMTQKFFQLCGEPATAVQMVSS